MYTERQKKHHFFWATLTKIQSIKINHYCSQISYTTSYQAHPKKQTFVWVKEEQNKVKLQEIIFQKSQKLLASRARTIASTAIT